MTDQQHEIVPDDAPEDFTPAADDGMRGQDDPGPVEHVHEPQTFTVPGDQDPFDGAQEAEAVEVVPSTPDEDAAAELQTGNGEPPTAEGE